MTNSVLCLSYCTHVQREIEIKPFTAAQWALAVPLIERVLHKVQSVCGSRAHATTPGKRRRTLGGFGPRVTNAARLRLDFASLDIRVFFADPPRTWGLCLPCCPGALRRPTNGFGGFASLAAQAFYTDLTTDSGILPPSMSGCSLPTRHGLGGFASLVVRALCTDTATGSGASPPPSSGCSTPTSPRTRGLRLPHRLGALR
uniref:Uncharacterized protein n=1 Tax=Oryza nivara TaxID=4536 RepID=A0A0E0HQV3_ORYNI